MEDYQSNAKSGKVQPPEEKHLEPVVSGKVVRQKKPLGRKIKDVFVEADFKSVIRYVCTDVLIPAAKNMIVDGAQEGIKRLVYGNQANRPRGYGYGSGSHYSYNNPINRGYSGGSSAPRPTPQITQGSRRQSPDDIILQSRAEAELVLERLNDVIGKYEFATVADLYSLVGLPSQHTDNTYGWVGLVGVQITQIREGFIIDLPPAEPISR